MALFSVFKKVREEIDLKRKESAAKRNLFQACYIYQAAFYLNEIDNAPCS